MSRSTGNLDGKSKQYSLLIVLVVLDVLPSHPKLSRSEHSGNSRTVPTLRYAEEEEEKDSSSNSGCPGVGEVGVKLQRADIYEKKHRVLTWGWSTAVPQGVGRPSKRGCWLPASLVSTTYQKERTRRKGKQTGKKVCRSIRILSGSAEPRERMPRAVTGGSRAASDPSPDRPTDVSTPCSSRPTIPVPLACLLSIVTAAS